MSLAPHTRLGPYEITGLLGAGGMGEVFKARDTRLGRDVAIKVLPASVASDPDRRARFERETQAVAALSHPNILAIFDTGIHEGQLFAVTELLQGHTLRDRLNSACGPREDSESSSAGARARGGGAPRAVINAGLPVRKAIEISIQIARGLAAAHAKGLVHRDLKPENIFLLEDGQVKILDFGLARQVGPETSSGATETIVRTEAGMVMGTIGYMAPEQVRGQTVDARADLFALGTVLYEMLSGRRAFVGETAADSMTAILTQEPPDLASITTDLPPALDRIVRHCLEKNPNERFQTARDVAFALESLSGSAGVSSGPAPVPIPVRSRRPLSTWVAASATGIVLLAAGWFGGRALVPPAAPGTATWLALAAPHGRFSRFPAPAISPDGTQVTFWAPDERDRVMLWLRRFDLPDARPLPGTESNGDSNQAFWAPDGKALAFFADGKLKRTSLDGGAPQTLADATTPRGGSWSREGRILFSPVSAGGVYTIPQAGGTPALVPIVDPEHRPLQWPTFLPDGRHFLISSTNGGVFLCSLDDPAIRKVSDARSRVEYSAGHVFFEQDGGLYAQAFDLSRFETSGAPVRISERIGYGFGSFIERAFSVSSTGRLVFAEGTWQPPAQLTWFDRSGRLIGAVGGVAESIGVVLSSDRTRALAERHDPKTNLTGPWVVDFASGTEARLATNQVESIELTPTWSADETRVFFSTLRGIFARQLRGGQIVRLLEQDRTVWVNDRSADGKFLLFEKGDPVTQEDVWVLSLGSPPTARAYAATNYTEGQAALSPDGRAVAYVSDESGRREVYVDSFPEPQTKIPISIGGGVLPEWRPDGRELYYVGSDRTLMAVAVDTAASPIKIGRPVKLFQMPPVGTTNNRHQYQPSATGDRFLVNVRMPTNTDPPVTVLLNWPAVVGK
jgi:serine/threonine protein kinase/Tol biopolymer transport system component